MTADTNESDRLVWLLREPQEPDPYEELLVQAGFQVASIPVLAFERVNADRCSDYLEHPERFGGLIITSPRAAAVLADCLASLSDSEAQLWYQRPAFTVGPRTADDLRQMGFEPVGEESGTGAELARIIDRTYRAELPLLFLCGDRRQEDLPRYLSRTHVSVEEMTVYRTTVGQVAPQDDRPEWIVVFSPSGVDALDQSDLLSAQARFAAIGPSTAAALRDRGVTVAAMADAPTPEALREALLAATP